MPGAGQDANNSTEQQIVALQKEMDAHRQEMIITEREYKKLKTDVEKKKIKILF